MTTPASLDDWEDRVSTESGPDASSVIPASQPIEETTAATATLARRRRWAAAVAICAAVAAGSGVVAASLIKSPSQAAAEAGPPKPSVLTSPVEFRTLTSSVVVRGQVTAGQSVDVAPQVSVGDDTGAAVVTKIPVKQGDTLKPGKVVLEVSGRPVFVLPGNLPVYRDLKPGAAGDDVKQLQKAMRGLGHSTGSDTEGTFGEGTKAALAEFYASIGYDPLPAVEDDGEGLKAAQGAVTSAERALVEAQESLEQADGEATSGAERTLEYAEDDLDTAQADLAAAQAAAGPKLPSGEVVFLQAFPARVDSVQGKVGGSVTGSVMKVSAGKLVVTTYLQEHQRGLVRKGQKVRIYSELSGIEATATVGSVSDSPVSSGGGQQDGSGDTQNGGTATSVNGYLLEVTPDKALDAQLAGQDVRLTIEAATTDGKALVIPITAVTAGADGRTTVTVVAPDATQRRVEIRTGTMGDGFVAVTPVGSGRLSEGEKVVTGVKQSSTAGGETR